MIVGEKLKLNKVVSNTKQAIGVISMGKMVGTDTRNMTDKKREEWAETIMNRSSKVSEMKKKANDENSKDIERQIKMIQKETLKKLDEYSKYKY